MTFLTAVIHRDAEHDGIRVVYYCIHSMSYTEYSRYCKAHVVNSGVRTIFMLQGCIKLIESDIDDVTKDFYFK